MLSQFRAHRAFLAITRAALSAIFIAASAASTLAGCGSHGGPGFRGLNGRCVGWSTLGVVCGDPPTTRCKNEGGKPPVSQAQSGLPSSGLRRGVPRIRLPVSPESGNTLPLNPDVTQATIGQTICVRGWTSIIRPPQSYTNRVKVRLLREQGLPLELVGDFQLDHRIPLALGGVSSDPRNLRLEDARRTMLEDASLVQYALEKSVAMRPDSESGTTGERPRAPATEVALYCRGR